MCIQPLPKRIEIKMTQGRAMKSLFSGVVTPDMPSPRYAKSRTSCSKVTRLRIGRGGMLLKS